MASDRPERALTRHRMRRLSPMAPPRPLTQRWTAAPGLGTESGRRRRCCTRLRGSWPPVGSLVGGSSSRDEGLEGSPGDRKGRLGIAPERARTPSRPSATGSCGRVDPLTRSTGGVNGDPRGRASHDRPEPPGARRWMVQLPAAWTPSAAGRSTRINRIAIPTITAVRTVPRRRLL
jgi:hypothetical protein